MSHKKELLRSLWGRFGLRGRGRGFGVQGYDAEPSSENSSARADPWPVEGLGVLGLGV